MPTAPTQQQNDGALLNRLRSAEVEFVVIGGLCNIYYGVPMATFDLDVCSPFTEQNLMKVEKALVGLNPYHRLAANRLPLELTPDLCLRLKNLYLQTTCGRLDILSEVAGIGGYEEVLKKSVVGSFPYGDFRLLTMDALIQSKEAAGRPKDLRAAEHLKALKENPNEKK